MNRIAPNANDRTEMGEHTMATKTAVQKLASIRNRSQSNIRMYREQIKKWSAELSTDPIYAFEWGNGAITAAAKIKVNQMIVSLIDNMPKSKMTPTERLVALHKTIQREALQKASWVPASSSQISNLASIHMTAELADAAKELQTDIEFFFEDQRESEEVAS